MKSGVKSLDRADMAVDETWDLTDLFINHAAWEKELDTIQKEITSVTQYKGKVGESASTLLSCLTDFEEYQKRLVLVATYANLKASADGTDPTNQRDSAKVSAALSAISTKISFVQSELLKLEPIMVENYLRELPALLPYKKMLEDILEKKKHILSPEVEETLAALGVVHDAPYMIYQRSKSADMRFSPITIDDSSELPMSAALYEDKYELSADPSIRRKAYQSFIHTLEQYKNTYAATYATEVSKQVTMSRLRSYESVTDMLLHPQQVTKEMYHQQLNVIQDKLAPHMQRYAKLKKEKLGLDKLHYYDLKAPLDPAFNPETSYDEAKTTILEALQVMGPEYSKIMEDALTNRWVDRANNNGKASGAFCSSPYGVHPYILVTWTDMMRGAFILAHELGHAGHFYLAGKNQAFINTRPSTYFVEAPSTLNELLLAEHLLSKTNDARMRSWIITQLLGTYYHNFVTHLLEGEFQRKVYQLAEEGTPLTANILSEQKLQTLENFWRDAVEFDEGAGLTWMRQPHYYMGLYPYTYSAGLTVSTAVAQQIKSEGKPAVDRWLDVLKAGGTEKPLHLIQQAGVDMSKPDAINQAVNYVASLIDELEVAQH
ncbi:oligoendopeptidase F [Virgibacillus sp. SK37]|uniref:oligoendopeptidase F n=1 Tax=Virgibacillus sp. SK37 TaxID=403957 RepID=UPI0004D0BAEA|nr:oligoendopeptidase F [Virgibacillus sp. SK37]AIF42723.1 oligoendopeptidase F [Virgibacillus sp. SK37]